ncbi:MAG: MtrB/PioB family decaheme-associated outer membrane protein [Betaproteobacteria bacterium]|nr:MtrB/PioB family decaheme-associated outer membrane protein [Betaproteobacteria bacterium]
MKKTRSHDFSRVTLERAVQFALLAMFAAPGMAAAQEEALEGEEAIKELTCPTNYAEIGILGTNNASTKFGEYNGLYRSGGYGIANFDVRGGDSYCQKSGTLRWHVDGRDLGTTSRSLSGSVAEQGKWSVGVGFDQLRHYTTTGFQTPYQGSPGDNVFVIPPGFGTWSNPNQLTPAQRAYFRDVDVHNERRNITFNSAYNLNTEWSFNFDYKRIDQSGAKLLSTASESATISGIAFVNQRVSLLMNPTEYTTDMFTAAANWVGEKAYAKLEYYASLFDNDNTGVLFSNANSTAALAAGGSFPLNTISTMPSNQLHQINFTGGYIFSPATKLTGGLSYSRNTQDMSYAGAYTQIGAQTAAILPAGVGSLDARVINKHADLRLTHQFTPAVNLNVGYKYNERDNQTDSNLYTFGALAVSAAPNVTVVNAPMSNRNQKFDASIGYRIDKQQRLNFGYEFERIQRWCNNDLTAFPGFAPQTAATAGAVYADLTTCAQVPKSKENRFNAGYKLSVFDTVDFNLGYTHSDREATVNGSTDFYNPMMANTAGFEKAGWVAPFQGSRRQDQVKAGVNWQATRKLDVSLDSRYSEENYYDTIVGGDNGRSFSANLDANYNFSEHMQFSGYFTWQERSRDMHLGVDGNAVTPPTLFRGNTLSDTNYTIGVNSKQKFLYNRLVLSQDVSYALSRSSYSGFDISPGVANGGATPDIRSKLMQVNVAGTYAINKPMSVRVGYLYQRLISNDYFYIPYQYGAGADTRILPNNLQSPNYAVNVLYVAYRYAFQ